VYKGRYAFNSPEWDDISGNAMERQTALYMCIYLHIYGISMSYLRRPYISPLCARSGCAKDFISRLLVKDPRQRLTAEQALSHEWIAQNYTSLGRQRGASGKDGVVHNSYSVMVVHPPSWRTCGANTTCALARNGYIYVYVYIYACVGSGSECDGSMSHEGALLGRIEEGAYEGIYTI
jgi:hypothetical protein